MYINDIIRFLETQFPLAYQESYDNSGLLLGEREEKCTGALVCLDVTEEVVEEAKRLNANLIIAHHPLIFKGLKKLTGSNYVERTLLKAIRYDIAIYAIHTNLDNVLAGVNGRMADRLSLINRTVLSTRGNSLSKLYTFVPVAHAEMLRTALFQAGAGSIGKYDQCSFNVTGTGTFRAGEGADPFVGKIGEQHQEEEVKVEVVFPSHLQQDLINVLRQAHPYEEVAFDVVALANEHPGIGSGLIGELETEMTEEKFLANLKAAFGLQLIRHTPLRGKPVKTVALCGGAGSFLTQVARRAGADVYITSDVKYHEFFDAEGSLVLADIGHYESEQFTIDLLLDLLREKFSSFAFLKTGTNTNPVRYLVS